MFVGSGYVEHCWASFSRPFVPTPDPNSSIEIRSTYFGLRTGPERHRVGFPKSEVQGLG